jgi:hypothetical protein
MRMGEPLPHEIKLASVGIFALVITCAVFPGDRYITGSAWRAMFSNFLSLSRLQKNQRVLKRAGMAADFIEYNAVMQLIMKSGSSRKKLVALLSILSVFLVIIVYIWFVSYGQWIHWKTNTTWYDQLASSFEHGQVSLQVTPSPVLLALHNPYDPGERKPLGYKNYIGDLSLYQGKYYLYFGPAPVIIDLVLKLLTTNAIGDQYPTFIYVAGILILQSLLLIRFRNRFYPDAPPWLMPMFILFVGLASPSTWLLSEASAYTLAIAGGQFFFLAGLYIILNFFDHSSIKNGRLSAAGILFALSVGSRLTQILPVSWIILMVIFFVFREHRENKAITKAFRAFLSMAWPLVLGLCTLGWYNWARFRSPFEAGLYYQLAGPFLQKYYQYIFSIRYVLPNLYDYLVTKPNIVAGFPYLNPPHDQGGAIFSFLGIPPIRNQGSVTGLLFTSPFIVFACIPIFSIFPWGKNKKNSSEPDRINFIYKWISSILFGSFLLSFGSLLTFFWVQTRYLADSMPSLLLLGILGFWQGDQALASQAARRKIYWIVGISLIVISIAVSTLLALYVNAYEFRRFDTGV